MSEDIMCAATEYSQCRIVVSIVAAQLLNLP